MLGAITSWVRWYAPGLATIDTPTPPDGIEPEQMPWLEWQRSQPPSHYEKSDMFQYYLTSHPEFKPPLGSCITQSAQNQEYYHYCFGDFACMIVTPSNKSGAVDYFSLLLDIYDTCKGYSRRLKGDPIGITLLRRVITNRSLTPLFNHEFSTYAYDYTQLHAHTVCQYSLSTLLMLLVSHYMYAPQTCIYYPCITLERCQRAYGLCVFGPNDVCRPTMPITIRSPGARRELHSPLDREPIGSSPADLRGEFKPGSWPLGTAAVPFAHPASAHPAPAPPVPSSSSSCPRCEKCNRITENIYGRFHLCLDCYMKRCCSFCGGPAAVIALDNLPRCHSHQ